MLIVKSTPLFFTASRNQVHSSISKLFFVEVIRQNVKSFLTEAERQFGLESIERQNPKIYAKSWTPVYIQSFKMPYFLNNYFYNDLNKVIFRRQVETRLFLYI